MEDHEIWRHMDGGHTRGYVRKTVVVRSIATVGHLDGNATPETVGYTLGLGVFSVECQRFTQSDILGKI